MALYNHRFVLIMDVFNYLTAVFFWNFFFLCFTTCLFLVFSITIFSQFGYWWFLFFNFFKLLLVFNFQNYNDFQKSVFCSVSYILLYSQLLSVYGVIWINFPKTWSLPVSLKNSLVWTIRKLTKTSERPSRSDLAFWTRAFIIV